MYCKNCGQPSGTYDLCAQCYKQKQEANKPVMYNDAETLTQVMKRTIKVSVGFATFINIVAFIIGLIIGLRIH